MEWKNLKQRAHVYSRLARIDKPIGTLLLLWPTFWGLWIATNGHPPILSVIIFALGTFLMRSAGCVINDFADRHFDAHVQRTQNRPLAQGQISSKAALCFAAVLTLLSASLLLFYNGLTFVLALIAALIAASYPFTKRFFPMPQAYLGLAFSFGIPMVFAAHTGMVSWLAWYLVLANAFWVLAYDTIYAICDKPDDLKLGIQTSAITLGRYDVLGVLGFHGVFIILMAAMGYYLSYSYPYFIALFIAILLIIKQYMDIKDRDRQRCFKAFLENNRIGYVLFLGVFLHFYLH